MAFRLVDKSGKSPWCFAKLPLYGIVPHGSTYTLTVTTKEEMKLKEETDFDLVIQSSLLGDKYNAVFNDQSESDTFFKEAKQFGNMVHEVTLKAVYVQYGEITSENISVRYNPDSLWSLDAHPTEPWIVTGHNSGYARVWNNEMKASCIIMLIFLVCVCVYTAAQCMTSENVRIAFCDELTKPFSKACSS